MIEVEHFLTAACKLGEGPLWHPAEKALYWVDIEQDRFHRFYPDTGNKESFLIGQPIGCLAFREKGGLVVALRDGLGFWNWETQSLELIANPEAGRENARFNDGKIDRQGRLWAGTFGKDDKSALYRLDPDGSVHTMETGITISNGIGWSPDDKTMYYTDSAIRTIYTYDFESSSGEISNRRIFVKVPLTEGFPDGLAVDSEGFIWSAEWDGWRVTRYDPEGKVERVIYLPVQRPTSCTFGGDDLSQLFITSAWTGLHETDRREQPLAGDLFRVQTEVKGQDVNYFKG
jgi:sugar lactone lactonase YvrE